MTQTNTLGLKSYP